jgi:hypothetical protein
MPPLLVSDIIVIIVIDAEKPTKAQGALRAGARPMV